MSSGACVCRDLLAKQTKALLYVSCVNDEKGRVEFCNSADATNPDDAESESVGKGTALESNSEATGQLKSTDQK
jgi:hypothetical protein